MSLTEPNFLKFTRGMFKINDSDFDNILKNLDEKSQKRLKEYSHFYYFICKPDKNEVREELRLVGITSLIEAMMSEIKFKSFFEYFESKYKGVNNIDNYQKLKFDYLENFGATKKIREYFKKQFSLEDKETLVSNIKIWKNGEKKFISIKDIKDFADILYRMRSEFVHEAKMRTFNPPGATLALLIIGDKPYEFKINIKTFMKIFEKSFVNYWKEKSAKIRWPRRVGEKPKIA